MIKRILLLSSFAATGCKFGLHVDSKPLPPPPAQVTAESVTPPPPPPPVLDPPPPIEICFSPVDDCDKKLAAFIIDAAKSLDIAVYDINLEDVVQAIIDQSKKLPVRVVVDLRQSKGSHSAVGKLIAAGVNLRYGHQAGIMHNKFTVKDGVAVETGSFNYTHHAALANNENQIYLHDPVVVSTYQKRFAAIWDLATTVEDQGKPKAKRGHKS